MKLKNIIEKIAISMMDNERYSDNDIINMIADVSDIEDTDRDGRTLLINAAAYKRTDVIKFLIGKGADVNACDKAGFTALHMASLYCDIPSIILLIESGAYETPATTGLDWAF